MAANEPSREATVRPSDQDQLEPITGRSEYREEWRVRKYDLTNLKADLENCTEVGRAFTVWGSIFAGASIATFLAWVAAMTTRGSPYWLRLTLGYGALVSIVLGAAMFYLDHQFAKKSHNDLTFVIARVSALIAMFDTENPSGRTSGDG